MFDAMMIAGWEIVEKQRGAYIVTPNGRSLAVYLRENRPLIYDVFDAFTHYNQYPNL
jgi:hypothetical protein